MPAIRPSAPSAPVNHVLRGIIVRGGVDRNRKPGRVGRFVLPAVSGLV
jgi:hypothetical protein